MRRRTRSWRGKFWYFDVSPFEVVFSQALLFHRCCTHPTLRDIEPHLNQPSIDNNQYGIVFFSLLPIWAFCSTKSRSLNSNICLAIQFSEVITGWLSFSHVPLPKMKSTTRTSYDLKHIFCLSPPRDIHVPNPDKMLYIYLCANLITSNYLLSSNYGLDLFWKYFLLLLPDWTGHVVNWGVDDWVSVNGKGVTAQRGDFGDSQWHTRVPPCKAKSFG